MINVTSIIVGGVVVCLVAGYVYYKIKEHNDEENETIVTQDSDVSEDEVNTEESTIIEDIDYTIINIENTISESEEIVFDADNFYIVGIVVPTTIESLIYFNYWLDKALHVNCVSVVTKLKELTFSFCKEIKTGNLPLGERFRFLGNVIWNIILSGPEEYKAFISAMRYTEKEELDAYRNENFI